MNKDHFSCHGSGIQKHQSLNSHNCLLSLKYEKFFYRHGIEHKRPGIIKRIKLTLLT